MNKEILLISRGMICARKENLHKPELEVLWCVTVGSRYTAQ